MGGALRAGSREYIYIYIHTKYGHPPRSTGGGVHTLHTYVYYTNIWSKSSSSQVLAGNFDRKSARTQNSIPLSFEHIWMIYWMVVWNIFLFSSLFGVSWSNLTCAYFSDGLVQPPASIFFPFESLDSSLSTNKQRQFLKTPSLVGETKQEQGACNRSGRCPERLFRGRYGEWPQTCVFFFYLSNPKNRDHQSLPVLGGSNLMQMYGNLQGFTL